MRRLGTGDKVGAFYFHGLEFGSDCLKSYHSTEPNWKLTIHFHVDGVVRGCTEMCAEMCHLHNTPPGLTLSWVLKT